MEMTTCFPANGLCCIKQMKTHKNTIFTKKTTGDQEVYHMETSLQDFNPQMFKLFFVNVVVEIKTWEEVL